MFITYSWRDIIMNICVFLYKLPDLFFGVLAVISSVLGIICLKKPRKLAKIITILIVSVLIYLVCTYFKSNLVEVPNVTNLTLANAKQTLNEKGVGYNELSVDNSNEWEVIKQSKLPGDVIFRDEKIDLEIKSIKNKSYVDENQATSIPIEVKENESGTEIMETLDFYDLIDASKIIRNTGELDVEAFEAFDYNKDGVVDLYDVIDIASELVDK